MTDSSRLILVDGSSYLFRAFHALPPLTNSKIGPLTPLILAQNDFLLLAALLSFFNLEGGVVTAVCNLLPGFSFL